MTFYVKRPGQRDGQPVTEPDEKFQTELGQAIAVLEQAGEEADRG